MTLDARKNELHDQETDGPEHENRVEPAEARETLRNARSAQMANRFGAAAWLFMNSASHRHLLLSDLEWLLVPALQLEQCRIIRSDGLPVAYAAWA
ncbi:toxin-activating lysine-acyltransferase [Marivibrio halodurans]|uniref:RTX toxin-activating lysine-acyltransferase n=1 Tax=Marivibrio halodurans TaxID=2039722 RepID=A0A8J7SKK6_9PROT|nr:toxin-activating lysine-acyltransferase [Marivibrio halodurans]